MPVRNLLPLLVFLLLSPSFSIAQFPTAVGTKWEYFQFMEDNFTPQTTAQAFVDEVVGDTLAGGNTYQIVRRTGSMLNGFGFSFQHDTLDGTYYYRVAGSQVRVLDSVHLGSAYESLLYEFGLSLGDTLHTVPRNLVNLTSRSAMPSYMPYYDFDTVCTTFGMCDTPLVLANAAVWLPWNVPGLAWNPQPTMVFDPNIGTLYSYPYIMVLDVVGQHYYLRRLSSNGQILYEHPAMAMEIADSVHSLGLQVSPNPASDRLFVRGNSRLTDIRLVNANGQVVMALPARNASATLDVEHLPRGLYWLMARSNEKVDAQTLLLR